MSWPADPDPGDDWAAGVLVVLVLALVVMFGQFLASELSFVATAVEGGAIIAVVIVAFVVVPFAIGWALRVAIGRGRAWHEYLTARGGDQS